jgi:DNA-binding transcriptional LysR family regulator
MLASNGAIKWHDRIGRRLKLNDVHAFLTVAEAGSMGKAAQRLSISQPSISKAIADIEHTIGVRLLDRTPRGVELTAYGRALVKRGINAFDELRQGIKDIEFLADPTAGEVRVGCPEAIASGLLLAVLTRFSRKYPRVMVNVITANDPAHELLRDRNVDFSLGEIPNRVAEEDLDTEVLYEDQLFIVSGEQNRWVGRRKIELAELRDEPWLLPCESIFTTSLAEAFLLKGLALPKPGLWSHSVHQRLSLLASDHFIGAESGALLRSNVERFPLRILPVDLSIRSFTVGIAALRNRTMSPITQIFIDCTRDIARSMMCPLGERAA